MSRVLLCYFCLLSVHLTTPLLHASAEQPAQASQITIFLDTSGSSPLPASVPFADQAASFVANRITQRGMIGDKIAIYKIGGRSIQNLVPNIVSITHKARPAKVAQAVGKAIASIPNSPELVEDSTSALYTVEVANISCVGRSEVIIITDGLDTGPESDMNGVLSGTSQFRAPPSRYLTGCRVTLLGVGAGSNLTADQHAHLKAAWKTYIQAAGADADDIVIESFVGF
jgi:hypothetical protein